MWKSKDGVVIKADCVFFINLVLIFDYYLRIIPLQSQWRYTNVLIEDKNKLESLINNVDRRVTFKIQVIREYDFPTLCLLRIIIMAQLLFWGVAGGRGNERWLTRNFPSRDKPQLTRLPVFGFWRWQNSSIEKLKRGVSLFCYFREMILSFFLDCKVI